MLRRNIDFFAVTFIALGLLAFSRLPQLGLPRIPDVRLERAVIASDQCPLTTLFGR